MVSMEPVSRQIAKVGSSAYMDGLSIPGVIRKECGGRYLPASGPASCKKAQFVLRNDESLREFCITAIETDQDFRKDKMPGGCRNRPNE